jgi:hypothetical protein
MGETRIVSIVCRKATVTEVKMSPPVFYVRMITWAVRALRRYVMYAPQTIAKVPDLPMYLLLNEKSQHDEI